MKLPKKLIDNFLEEHEDKDGQTDMVSPLTELDCVKFLLTELNADLSNLVMRLRYLTDLGLDLGSSGTMLLGGHTTYAAWIEARSSFLYGNYLCVTVTCQALMENILAAVLYADTQPEDFPKTIQFKETLKRCLTAKLISSEDHVELERLMNFRNPLSLFRDINDPKSLSRRSIVEDCTPDEVLKKDTWFAIGLVTKILSRHPFRVG